MARVKRQRPTFEECLPRAGAIVPLPLRDRARPATREWRHFDESETVRFVTECIYPDRFKGREGQVTLWPEPALADSKPLAEDDVLRSWVGYIRATKGEFETSITLPPSACWRLAQAMASGLVRSMLTNGPVETRGMYRVTSASFYGVELDPVAYVG